MGAQSFKDLIVWQKAKQLTIKTYIITREFPSSECYGLTSQMRRAAVSIASNIAEGFHRIHKQEKRQFVSIAFSSAAEFESHVNIAKDLFPNVSYQELDNLLEEIKKILGSILYKMKKENS